MLAAEDFQKHMAPLFPGLMGIKIVEASKDKIVASMRVRPDLCTAGGLCHGGAYMALADTLGAIGTVVNLPPNTRTTTIESKTNFLLGRQAVRCRHANADGIAGLKARPRTRHLVAEGASGPIPVTLGASMALVRRAGNGYAMDV